MKLSDLGTSAAAIGLSAATIVERERDAAEQVMPPGIFLPGVNLAGAEFDTANLPGTYGTHYAYPPPADVDYFHAKGFRVFRIPFAWERLQRTLNGNLDTAEIGRIVALVDHILGLPGTRVVLDPHNYGHYSIAGTRYPIGSPQVPVAAFANFWVKLGSRFKDRPRVILGIMNEPTTLISEWGPALQAAITAIREAGIPNRLYLPGVGFTGAHSFFDNGSAAFMEGLRDPFDNWAIEVHQYLDGDNSGTSPAAASDTVGPLRVQRFTEWCRQRGFRAFLGEFNAGDNAMGAGTVPVRALLELYDHLIANRDVWEATAVWSGGERWGDSYYFQMQPSPLTDPDRLRTLLLAARKADPVLHDAARLDLNFAASAYRGVAEPAEALRLTQAGRLFGTDAAGNWLTFCPGTLRITDRGLWTEAAKTNYLASHLFTPSGVTNVTAATGMPAPDGSANAVLLSDTTANGPHYVEFGSELTGLAIGDTVTYSAFVKKGPDSAIAYAWLFNAKPDAHTVLDLTRPQDLTPTPYLASGTWRRPSLTQTYASPGPDAPKLGLTPNAWTGAGHVPDTYAGGSGSLHVWHKQIEKGPFASSPILLTAKNSSATRAADVVDVIGPLLSLMQGNACTLVFEVERAPEVALALPLVTVNGTAVLLRRNVNHGIGGDVGATLATAVPTDGAASYRVTRRIGVSYRRTGTQRIVVGLEGVAAVGANATIPAFASARLGPFEGFIRSIQAYDTFHDTAALDALLLAP